MNNMRVFYVLAMNNNPNVDGSMTEMESIIDNQELDSVGIDSCILKLHVDVDGRFFDYSSSYPTEQ